MDILNFFLGLFINKSKYDIIRRIRGIDIIIKSLLESRISYFIHQFEFSTTYSNIITY